MKQHFIDISGSMDNAQIISALNTIGYECLDREQAFIHLVDLLRYETINLLAYLKDSCREMSDECIFYTDGLCDERVLKFFDKVVILK